MRDFCLSVSLCLAAVAAMLSACLLLPLIDHSPAHLFNPTPSSSHPTIISGSLRNDLAMWGYSGTKKGCDPVTPKSRPSWPERHTFSFSSGKTKTSLIMRLRSSKEKNRKPLYQCGALTIIYPHDLWFLRQGLLDTYNREVTARRLSISRLGCPYLFSSPSPSSLHLVCTT